MAGRPKVWKKEAHYTTRVTGAPRWQGSSKIPPVDYTKIGHLDSLPAVVKNLTRAAWRLDTIEVDDAAWKYLKDEPYASFNDKNSFQVASELVKHIPDIIAVEAGRLKITRSKLIVYIIHNPNRVEDESMTFRFCIHVRTKQSMKALLEEVLVHSIMVS